MFNIMRAHQLKMNPTKSFLGVSSGKFLGFILDPDKVEVIQGMQPPKTLKEFRGLQGRLAYIRRFITNLSNRCQPFTWLMKKCVPSYRMKLGKRLSKISKNILPSLQSWWLLFQENHSCSIYELWTTPWALFLHRRMMKATNRPSAT